MKSKKGLVEAATIMFLVIVAALSGFYYLDFADSLREDHMNEYGLIITDSGKSVKAEKLYSNRMYINNEFESSVQVIGVKIDGNTCYINGSYSYGISTADTSQCTSGLSSSHVEVTIETEKGTFSQTLPYSGETTSSVVVNPDLTDPTSFTLSKTPLNSTASMSTDSTFSIVVTNTDVENAVNFVLIDEYNTSQFNYSSSNETPVWVNYSAGQVRWNVNVTAEDFFKTINVNLTVLGNGTYTNSVTLRNSSFGSITTASGIVNSSNTTDGDEPGGDDPNPLCDDRVAHFHFDNNASVGENSTHLYDFSGSGNNGTIINGSSNSGKFGNATRFDGSNTRIELGTFDILGNHTTIAFWVNFDDFGVSDARIISKATDWGVNDHYWMVSTTGSGPHYARFRLRTEDDTETFIANGAAQQLSTGEWQHIVVRYNNSEMSSFRNGVIDASSVLKSGRINTSNSVGVEIGDNPGVARDRFLDGLLDEMIIWNVSLNNTQINELNTSTDRLNCD